MCFVQPLRSEALVDFVALVSRCFHQDKISFEPMTPIEEKGKDVANILLHILDKCYRHEIENRK
jgi:hypothetical protein